MRSFIREDISRALKLPVIGEETINLYTFGSDKPRQAKYKIVKTKLKNVSNGQNMEVQLLETRQVCTSKMHTAGAVLCKELELKGLRSTIKLCIVFDGSAHENNKKSLNECLLTGPNLNPELLDILISSRQHPVAFMADISKAFLQIEIDE